VGLSSESIMVDYYLSDDTTFGDGDDRKIGDTGFTVDIGSGATRPICLSQTGLENMVRDWAQDLVADGNYYVYAEARVTDGSPSDPTPGNDYGRTSSPIRYIAEGTDHVIVLSAADRRETFRDEDGDIVTVSFAGPGTATVTRGMPEGQPGDIESIAFDGTSQSTKLTIAVNERTGNQPEDGTTVQTISGDAVGTLTLTSVDIPDGGSIDIGGDERSRLTLKADEIGDVDMRFAGILTATVKRWEGGTIDVGQLRQLTVKSGNLGADVEADRIGTVKVTGGSLSGNLHAQNVFAERPDLGLALGSVTVTGGNITGSIAVDNQGNARAILAKAVSGVGGAIGDQEEDTIVVAGRLTSYIKASGDIRTTITVNNETGSTRGNALELVQAIGGSIFGDVTVVEGNLGTLKAKQHLHADVTVAGKARSVQTGEDHVTQTLPTPPANHVGTITVGGAATVKGKNQTIKVGAGGGEVYVVHVA